MRGTLAPLRRALPAVGGRPSGAGARRGARVGRAVALARWPARARPLRAVRVRDATSMRRSRIAELPRLAVALDPDERGPALVDAAALLSRARAPYRRRIVRPDRARLECRLQPHLGSLSLQVRRRNVGRGGLVARARRRGASTRAGGAARAPTARAQSRRRRSRSCRRHDGRGSAAAALVRLAGAGGTPRTARPGNRGDSACAAEARSPAIWSRCYRSFSPRATARCSRSSSRPRSSATCLTTTGNAFADSLAEAGREGSLAFVWTARPAVGVHDYWGLWLQQWPGEGPELVAHADFHGAWLEWPA